MSDLGMLLRKTRLEQKISLDDLQETTKIRKRYLEAIEDGNFKVLPGSFYVRAFIKSYAETVGLEPSEVLKMYQNTIPVPTPEPTIDPIRKKRASSRNTDRLSRGVSTVMMVSFVLLILGIIYYYAYQNYKGTPTGNKGVQDPRITDKADSAASSNSNNNANNTNSSAAVDKKTEPSPTPVPKETPAPSKPEVKLSSSEKGTDFYTVTNAAKLSIQLKVSGSDCWIEVDAIKADNQKELQKSGTLKSGELYPLDLDTSAFIIVGKSNAVELTVNGVLISVGDMPNPKRIQLNLQKT